MRTLFLGLALVFALKLQAQDSTRVFSLKDYLRYVQAYHPLAWQAALRSDAGKAAVLMAKGGFDPKLAGSFDQKHFDGTPYYSLLGAGLKVPTWFGLELKAGFDQNEGVYLNPENRVPPEGLVYGGVSMTLGQGLFIDKRRAALQQARVYRAATENEQLLLLNQLYQEALQAYFFWIESYQQLEMARMAYDLALERKEAVVGTYLGGARPAIDTLEAFIQLQTREFNLNKATLQFQKNGLLVSNFLWLAGEIPLEMEDFLVPENWTASTLLTQRADSLAGSGIPASVPSLLAYQYKIRELDIDRRYKTEMLKPRVDVQYNLLNSAVDFGGTTGISSENYKWGLHVSMPLFLRNERGDLRLARIKLREAQLQRNQKQLELNNKLRSGNLELRTLKQQISLMETTTSNYQRLLDGERRRFMSGESSLFLVNSRELSFLDSRTQLISLNASLLHTRIDQMALLGILPQEIEAFLK